MTSIQGRTAVYTIGQLARASRYALGGIRVVNGTLGLLAPGVIIRRFGDSRPGSNPAAIYGLRLFGIRTLLIGADLFLLRGAELDRALRSAVVIHASDTATVLLLWRRRQLAPDRARPLALISGINTALALTAALASRRSRPAPTVSAGTRRGLTVRLPHSRTSHPSHAVQEIP
jgi:hypothetical protein